MDDRKVTISILEKIKRETGEIGLDVVVLSHDFIDDIIKLLKQPDKVVLCEDCKYYSSLTGICYRRPDPGCADGVLRNEKEKEEHPEEYEQK